MWDRNRTCTLRLWRPNPACREPLPDAALPHSRYRLMPPNVAVCRRSLGHTMGRHKQSEAGTYERAFTLWSIWSI
jgi:hypothetical protein